MRINKLFTVIVLSAVVFVGTTFETRAINLSDYVPNVSVWVTNFVNNLRLYKNMFWAFILRKEIRPLVVDKVAIIDDGSLNYAIMLDRMPNFKNDMNRRELCQFMQQFVQNYVNSSDQEKALLKIEHDLFNARLKELRNNNVSWLEITCLNDEQYRKSPNIFIKTWAFLEQLKKFDDVWVNDQSLDAAIRAIENKI